MSFPVHVGTSGYNYPEWKGTFYPEKWPASKMFGYYAERFRTVEINYSFYRMPTTANADAWRAQAPDGFTYTLKAPKRITHERRLVDCAEPLTQFVTCARHLGPHLACLLFQLPPNFRSDVARLDAFLGGVPADLRVAVEFRHESWHDEAVFEVLRRHNAALCIADFGDKTTPLVATARHGYFRLRDEGYQSEDLARWAASIAALARDWNDTFVYFKHEDEGKGPEFARRFIDALPGAPTGE
jgi:uncharacterized protein YecE (DUF72 family)